MPKKHSLKIGFRGWYHTRDAIASYLEDHPEADLIADEDGIKFDDKTDLYYAISSSTKDLEGFEVFVRSEEFKERKLARSGN